MMLMTASSIAGIWIWASLMWMPARFEKPPRSGEHARNGTTVVFEAQTDAVFARTDFQDVE